MLRSVEHPEYKVGQVWAYNTREIDTGSTLMVVKTEIDDRLGSIIHISVQGVQMRNPHDESGICSVISHLPCSEEAVQESVSHILSTSSTLPDFDEGYQEWREAFDAGRAGIWGIPVSKMVDAMETVLNQS